MPAFPVSAHTRVGYFLMTGLALIFLTISLEIDLASADDGPSFDCAKARSVDEKLICADAHLSYLDRSLADTYLKALEGLTGGKRGELIAEQKRWVKSRNKSCGINSTTKIQPKIYLQTPDCFENQMGDRGKQLDAIVKKSIEAKALNDYRAHGLVVDILYSLSPDQISDSELMSLISREPATSALRVFGGTRINNTDSLFKFAIDHFASGEKFNTETIGDILYFNVCHPGIFDFLGLGGLPKEASLVWRIFLVAAKCPSLGPIRTLSSHAELLNMLDMKAREDVVSVMRNAHKNSGLGTGESHRSEIEKILLSDPGFSPSDWTVDEAIEYGASDPEKALKALTRYDNPKTLLWRALFIQATDRERRSRSARIRPLLRQAGLLATEPDSGDAKYAIDNAESYNGELGSLVDFVLYLTGGLSESNNDLRGLEVPCSFLISFPDFFPLGQAYYGGNRDNYTPRFDCSEYGRSLPDATSSYLNIAYGLYLGNHYYEAQGGTLKFFYYKLMTQILLKMRLLPHLYFQQARLRKLEEIPLRSWSNLSLWNNIEFETRAKPLFLKARDSLAQYYRDEFKLLETDSVKAAHEALWDYMNPTDRSDNVYKPESVINPLILNGASLGEIGEQLAADETWNRQELWIDSSGFNNVYKDPPLQNAVTQPEIVDLLLSHGGDPNLINWFGRTPLMTAAFYDNITSVNLLLKAGAKVNTQSAESCFTDVSEIFADFSYCRMPYYGRRSVLMYAAANASLPLIKTLLNHGASKSLTDDWGLTALDYLRGDGPVPANAKLSPDEMRKAAKLLAP